MIIQNQTLKQHYLRVSNTDYKIMYTGTHIICFIAMKQRYGEYRSLYGEDDTNFNSDMDNNTDKDQSSGHNKVENIMSKEMDKNAITERGEEATEFPNLNQDKVTKNKNLKKQDISTSISTKSLGPCKEKKMENLKSNSSRKIGYFRPLEKYIWPCVWQ